MAKTVRTASRTEVSRLAEQQRLEEDAARRQHWKRWGPYLSERAWGTVREDYSPHGTAWEAFPHDHARSRAYRWNEDGLGGISDRHQYICFAIALWNGRDPILKERAFGVTGNEGNHGEDVKEYYFYLDSTPTHSYMKYLYKYPQAEFPYARLIEENHRRQRGDVEYELIDTGIFDENRYFDVVVEYAKTTPEDLFVRIHVTNRGPASAELTLLPTLWFRNTWAWGIDARRPRMRAGKPVQGMSIIEFDHEYYGQRRLWCEGKPPLLFTENETNTRRLYGDQEGSTYVKDSFHDYVIHGQKDAINPEQIGSKAAAHYVLTLPPGASEIIRLRLTDKDNAGGFEVSTCDGLFTQRIREANEFYDELAPPNLSEDARRVQRQAFAGLLWSKQFYHYDLRRWLVGDPGMPDPPQERLHGRNSDWTHLYNADVISMPDKWEYPWYAAWDLAFHCIPLALVDSTFAKEQLLLMLREWYMHPNGQIPAYEWAFGDVNPPVHAWAAWRVYKIEKKRKGVGDRVFLERVFHKLLLNFTWWVNRKDAEGKNIFQGGFLGLDNIGVFDRSAPLPTGGHIEQSDATSWMGMYCLNMLSIALELARENRAYEDVASKFFEHFVYICRAMNNIGGENIELWNRADG
ncbi:MAG: glucosidase, partial [Nitrospira sp.]|nr:glucosidase [Nitrospira sp.]